MDIVRSARQGCVVLTLVGTLDLVAAPTVQRALLRCLAEQPDAVICDLSRLEELDPGCATVFAAVAHRPRNRWPDSSLVLCCGQPAVAAVLQRLRPPHLLPYHRTLDEAITQVRSRPAFLREEVRLVPTLEAVGAARWFAAEVSRRWELDEATEAAQLLAGELVADAAVHENATFGPIELRMELRATGLFIAVHGGGSDAASAQADADRAPGSQSEVVRRVAHASGVRAEAGGPWIRWCVLRHPT
jgi:anti-anti-sigma regulatory factor